MSTNFGNRKSELVEAKQRRCVSRAWSLDQKVTWHLQMKHWDLLRVSWYSSPSTINTHGTMQRTWIFAVLALLVTNAFAQTLTQTLVDE